MNFLCTKIRLSLTLWGSILKKNLRFYSYEKYVIKVSCKTEFISLYYRILSNNNMLKTFIAFTYRYCKFHNLWYLIICFGQFSLWQIFLVLVLYEICIVFLFLSTSPFSANFPIFPVIAYILLEINLSIYPSVYIIIIIIL